MKKCLCAVAFVILLLTGGPASAATDLIRFGDVWRYLDDGSNQGTNWSARGFDDGSWASGPAQLGYSSNPAELDEATTVSFGPSGLTKYVTTYFRRSFTVANAAGYTNLVARLLVDDGAVVYLNGQEMYRANMPAGVITNRTFAPSSLENARFTNSFRPTALLEGANVIAVEVHQQSLTSSDLSFDFALQAEGPGGINLSPVVALTAPVNGDSFVAPAVIPLAATATDPDGLVTGVEFYAGAVLLWATNAGPYVFTWNDAPAGNHVLTAVAVDDAGRRQTSAPVAISVTAPLAPVTNSFVLFGAAWRYLDDGSDQGTAWRAPEFNDSAWASGPAQLGYGDGDEATVVGFGPNSGAKFITTYFRHTFPVTNAAGFTNLSLRLLRDDAGVVYVNGTEVFRSPNLPAGDLSHQTPAAGSAPPDNFIDTASVAIAGLLREGANVVAVEVHQQAGTSSDLSFDFELTGVRPGERNPRPQVALTYPPRNALLGTPGTHVLAAGASDADGTVTNVLFLANGVVVGQDAVAPFEFPFVNPAPGAYTLAAVATDNDGQSATSSVVSVTVSAAIAPPVVQMKSPAPGTVTSLGAVTVVFSKPVTGVHSADLLLNGVPATGVGGTGTNFTFTFPQPPYGPVDVTWAASHGITDLFTPPAVFATNSAGANWQYQLVDVVPPAISALEPPAGFTVSGLSSLSVAFSEAVAGVQATDLRINGAAATNVTGSGAGPYTFSFPPAPAGNVTVAFIAIPGIVDSAGNAFAPVSWNYTVDTNLTGVVISEIMYHPPTENVLDEYVEIHNPGASAVRLGGWQFTAGMGYTFPSGTMLPGGGYLVVAASVAAFTNRYPGVTNVIGNWTGTLNNNGEEIRLEDSAGNTVASVRYADEGDWAVRQRGALELGHRGWVWFNPHDGDGASLELMNPRLGSAPGQNWAASRVPNGTPGARNSVHTNNLAPLIRDASHFPVIPTSADAVLVTARLTDESTNGISASLFWRVDAATPPAFTNLAMRDDGLSGDAVARDGLWSARIPAQANNRVIEFYIQSVDAQGLSRTWPAPAIAAADGAGPTGQVVNALFQVDDVPYSPTNAQPLYKLIMTEVERAELQVIPSQSSLQGPNSRMNGTFVSVDGSGIERRYNAGFRNRGHGSRLSSPPNYHVDFRSDERWRGVTALNLNSVNVHVQHLGSVLARKAGADGGATVAAQVRVNNANRASSGGGMYGSYAANEVPDGDFAASHYPLDPSGNVYRAVRDIAPPDFSFRGGAYTGYTNTWFKENNQSENDWSDLIAMLSVVGTGNPVPFTTDNVRAVVDVEQWMRHLAVMNLFGNNESGLNTGYNDDYYLHAGRIDRRVRLLYWDLDSILGQGGSLAANSGLFTATANNGSGVAFDRFLNWVDFQPVYFRTLSELLNGPFSQASFDATADQVLGGYVPVDVIAGIKAWMSARRAHVLGQLPPITDARAPVATVTGGPRSPTPFATVTFAVGGPGVGAYRFSLNGGGFSAEIPVATPIQLAGLANGTNTLAVLAVGTNGVTQASSDATVVTWDVNTSLPTVRLNEVLARNAAAVNHSGTFPDVIELFNEGAAAVSLAGMRLSNNPDQPGKFTFPAGTTLAAGAYLVVYAGNADGTPGFHLGFTLAGEGDSVHLFAPASAGGARLDSVKFGRQLVDLSIGRLGTAGQWHLGTPTPSAANTARALGAPAALRINEWLAAGAAESDFIEVYNPAAQPVALGGLFLTDNVLGDPARNRLADLAFIGAGEFLPFRASGNGNGGDQLNFKLAIEHGEIGLLDGAGTVLDCVWYGPQIPDRSEGRCPNGGTAVVVLGTPTGGSPNDCPFVPPAPVTTTLVGFDATWSWHNRTNLDGVNWTTNDFDDAAWPAGPGLLGQYTPTRPQTLPEPIRTVTPTNLNFPTLYARSHFAVQPGTTYTSLRFRHIIDDGAAFYLNGVEIPGSRLNLPAGAAFATPASATVPDGVYSAYISVPVSMLLPGGNVFAVEVHQSAPNSSDVALGVQFEGLVVTNSPAAAGVLINEVLANNASLAEPDGSLPDWIELYNPSAAAVDLGDMSLTDDTTVSRRWVFPAGTILNGLGYLRVRCDSALSASGTNTGFGLKANGGSVFLFNRIADGGSVLSSVTYGLQPADFTLGRVPTGGTNWALCLPTPGGNNLAATLGNPALLRLNEWMADPASGEDYFEIFNPNPQPVDISRFYLTDDLAVPTRHQIPARSYLGVGQDAFQSFVADNDPTAGADHVKFRLAAGGEAIGLSTAAGVPVDQVSFGSQVRGVSQGRLPDGATNVVNFTSTPTPGRSNFLPLEGVVINEVLSHTDLPLEDAVELFNPGPAPVDISGWYLSDSQNNLLKYRLPTNTVIAAGGYTVLYEYQFNDDAAAERFSFSSARGDEVYLSQSTSPGTLTGYRAYATFGAAANGVSFGRHPTSLGFDFTAMTATTFGRDDAGSVAEFRQGGGLPNATPRVGPVVINEIMYHPAGTNDVLEYLELHNLTGAPVPLFDVNHPANTWRLRKGVDFDFPAGLTIPARGFLVVVGFDPVADPASLALFQAAYGTNFALVGPYAGKLANDSEPVELQRPDDPQTVAGPDFGYVPRIVVDRVVYGDTAPWPVSPDGTGDALARISAGSYGNEPLNWRGGVPTPGAANQDSPSNQPPVLQPIASRSVHAGYPVTLTAAASDPDQPGQTLVYSLAGNPPAGATMDGSSGVFSWTTATNQVPGDYTLTVQVSDSGVPSLTDSASFVITVLPLPRVSVPVIAGGQVTLTWASHPGRRYRVETTVDLGNPDWVPVGGDIIPAGTTATLVIPGGADAQRYYRVVSYDP